MSCVTLEVGLRRQSDDHMNVNLLSALLGMPSWPGKQVSPKTLVRGQVCGGCLCDREGKKGLPSTVKLEGGESIVHSFLSAVTKVS